MKKIILTSLLISFCVVPLVATDYFVSKTGNADYISIQEAVDVAQAGDTIYIKAGTYNERVYLENSGTKSNPINITNFSNDKVIVDGNGISWGGQGADRWGGLFDISQISYINVSNIEIRNAYNAALFLDTSKYITIENIKTHNSYSSGMGVWYSDNIVLNNNEISLACNDGGEESISVVDSHDVNVTNTEVHHSGPGTNGGEGIDIKMGSYKVLVKHNHVHHINNRIGLYADAWNKYTTDITFDSNIVHDCTDTGMAVATEQGGLIEDVSFVNNIVYNNSDGGMAVGGWSEDYNGTNPVKHINILHNTFYANGNDGIYIANNDIEDINIYNNIIANSQESQIYIENSPLDQIDIRSNIIMGATYRFDHSNDIVANPNFVNVANKDFHLRSDSPAINTGIVTEVTHDFDNNTRPNGTDSDIGAYEFVTNTISNAINDFNNDGTSDILWRSGGTNHLWQMQTDGTHTYVNIGTKSSSYIAEEIADFNGDGIVDILWRKGHKNYIWYMHTDGTHSYKKITSKSYEIIGAEDFNNDGKADILWRKDKQNHMWYMNADGTHTYQNIGTKSTDYTIAGLGDLNGDGITDILWRKGHKNYIWYMNTDGTHSYKKIGSKSYNVQAVKDFNNDGIADILWRKDNKNHIWYMNTDGTYTYQNIGNKASSYTLTQVGDYNGDGVNDILWRKDSSNYLWTMHIDGTHTYKKISEKNSGFVVVDGNM